MSAKQKLSPSSPRAAVFLCLFLAIDFLCAPTPSRADSLEDAARSLARKVASILSPREGASISIRNLSSLSLEQISILTRVIEGELQSREHKVSHDDSYRVSLRLTFSENLTGILEIAELVENGQSHFSLERATLATIPSGDFTSRKFTLVKELVWKQESHILDLKFLSPAAEKPERMAVLSQNALSFHENKEAGWSLLKAFPIPRSRPQSRDPRGQLFQSNENGRARLVASFPGLGCFVDLSVPLDFATLECTSNPGEELVGLSLLTAGPDLVDNAAKWNSSGNAFTGEIYGENGHRLKIAPFYSAAFLGLKPGNAKMFLITAGIDGRVHLLDNGDKELREFTGWGSELTTILSDCDNSWHVLTSGRTDWTENDKVTMYKFEEPPALSLEQSIELSGPVLSLGSEQVPLVGGHQGSRSGGVAVVQNVKTGEYEAYRISLACSR